MRYNLNFFLFLAGFVISAICELERNAIQLALGSFYPTLLLSGTYEIEVFTRETKTLFKAFVFVRNAVSKNYDYV